MALTLPAEITKYLPNFIFSFPALSLSNYVDISHFVLTRDNRSDLELIKKFLEGCEMILKHLENFPIVRIFIR